MSKVQDERPVGVLGAQEIGRVAVVRGGNTVPATRMTTLKTKRGRIVIYRWFHNGMLFCTLNWNRADQTSQWIEVIW